MFGQNKKDTQDVLRAGVSAQGSKADSVANATVRTMHDDLAGLPIMSSEVTQTQDMSANNESAQVLDKMQREQSSSVQTDMAQDSIIAQRGPFLDNQQGLVNNSEINSPYGDEQLMLKNKKRHSIMNLLAILAIVAILITLVAYYFLRPKVSDIEIPATNNSTIQDTDIVIDNNTTEVDNFVETIGKEQDIESIDIAQISNPIALTAKLQQLAANQRNMGKALIITIADDGVPMLFSVFAKQFLPALPQNLLNAMDAPFEISIMSDGVSQQIGIAALTRDTSITNTVLRNSEMLLPNALSPLYLFEVPDIGEVPVFSDSSYYGIPMRFYNFLPGSDTQGLSYATHYERVFFATSLSSLEQLVVETLQKDQNVLRQHNLEGLIDQYPPTDINIIVTPNQTIF